MNNLAGLHLDDIAHVIQLAVAPVFLLTAIATLINAMNGRLARIVDRRRAVLDRLRDCDTATRNAEHNETDWELAQLAKRSKLVYYAIFSAVLAALLVCLVVAGAFIGALLETNLGRLVAAFFVLAMFTMVASLGFFLREVYLAVSGGTHNRR